MHQGIRGNMLHLQYKHNSLCLLESCKKGSLNTTILSLHTVLWGLTEIIHPVLTMSAGQPALKCLDRPCVTFVHLLPWASTPELSSESRWGEGAVSLTCVLPGRIYCLLRYFFWEGVGQPRFAWPLHRFPWYVLELQGHRGVIYGRCQMNAVPHAGVNTLRALPVLLWIMRHHIQEDIHRELEGFRITDELFIFNEHIKSHFVLLAD